MPHSARNGFAPERSSRDKFKPTFRGRALLEVNQMIVIRNGDLSFLFRPDPDGDLMPSMPEPIVDSYGKRADFSRSASISGAAEVVFYGQGQYDFPGRHTALAGIAKSRNYTWEAALKFFAN